MKRNILIILTTYLQCRGVRRCRDTERCIGAEKVKGQGREAQKNIAGVSLGAPVSASFF